MEDCPLHDHMENCLSIIKNDIKDIEKRDEQMAERISALEPTVKHNEQAISAMRKFQLGTLVSALISAIGVISGLLFFLLTKPI